MHLFSHAEHLTAIEWILRAVIAYVFLLLAAKLMGQRSIAQLRFADVVLALLLGGNLSNPLTDERLDLGGAMITTFVLIVLHASSSALSLKWERWRTFLEPSPLLLIRNGDLQLKNLQRARISIDYLFSELRLQNIDTFDKVGVAFWEPGGNISAFLKPEYEPLARRDVNIKGEATELPVIVIKQGKIRKEALASLGNSEAWIHEQLQDIVLTNVLLATANSKGIVHLILEK
ncbi:DUF421 domain-containing protein [Ectobacillus antri]|jgi:uncharacterized membrane protein YcaP (DUF421 family)|uniref:DUF421 domain-containing protein n=1 Tax=Ectobacillus antri TaxID=2486280 RepID=A0ABT6H3L5_9BACI|nr:YetF domain-containing protein [Ectobacillus antri]MDG4655625.1 DUF421 domain-containing protein [Ectobacillus antri]MDG5753383.1 DUF421 domain-containing protein [Ectobacillus antri]